MGALTEKAHVEERRLAVVQLEAAADYRQAAAAEQEIETKISEFHARTAAFERQGAALTEAVSERRAELEVFESWPLACYETLRARTSKRQEEVDVVKKIGTEPEPVQAIGGQ